jgi:hypothetical protein
MVVSEGERENNIKASKKENEQFSKPFFGN